MSIRSNMDARRADQRVTFERNTPSQDNAGQDVEQWAPLVRDVPVAIDGDKAREVVANGGERSRLGYTVWVRADIVSRFTITEADRILWGSKVLNIRGISDQQLRGRWTALLCETGVNEG